MITTPLSRRGNIIILFASCSIQAGNSISTFSSTPSLFTSRHHFSFVPTHRISHQGRLRNDGRRISNLKGMEHDKEIGSRTTSTLDFPFESSTLTSIISNAFSHDPTSHISTGLTEEEVDDLLYIYGPNALTRPPKETLWQLWLGEFDNSLIQVLLGVAIFSSLFSLTEFVDNFSASSATSILRYLDGIDKGESITLFQSFVEPLTILLILILNATVGVWQSASASQSIEALEKLQPRLTTVLRRPSKKKEDSMEDTDTISNDVICKPEEKSAWIIGADATMLVPGDVIRLKVGDCVPADVRIANISSSVFSVDESSLTGESSSVYKYLAIDEDTAAFSDDLKETNISISEQRGMAFSGTMVTAGTAIALVVRTGMNTQLGKIQKSVMSVEKKKTPLGEKLDSFGKNLSFIIAVICVIVWVASIPHFNDPSFGSSIEGAMYYAKIGVSLGVAAIPEGLPAVITLCLALGTRRMVERNVIVTKLPSVETLGCTTVICSDKTGTLTTNQMTAVSLVLFEDDDPHHFSEHSVSGISYNASEGFVEGINSGEIEEFPNGSVADVILVSKFCNDAELIVDDDGTVRVVGEPTEGALLYLIDKLANNCQKRLETQWERYCTFEFDPNRKRMSVLCRRHNTDEIEPPQHKLLVKGAPELLLERCSKIKLRNGNVISLTPALRQNVLDKITSLSRQPLRCLLIAVKEVHEDVGVTYQLDTLESNLILVGCVGIKDPPRVEARKSIDMCKLAGIRVLMITGDAKETAITIARDVGIFSNCDEVDSEGTKAFTGKEFFLKPTSEQISILNSGNAVLCRTEPIDKQKIVQVLQSMGEVVSMTGDGVNDAPALQQASIGISMGSGTDVAKEAADMILVDDSFSTIVNGIEEGRCIYANMQAFINFLISCNIGEVVAVLLATLLGFPSILSALHLLWVNLVTDGPPATALCFNPPDESIMHEKPRKGSEEIISQWLLIRYTVVGLYIGLATVGIFASEFISRGVTVSELSTWTTCNEWSSSPNTCTELFENRNLALPQTLALTTLVTTELLKALSTVSVQNSLFEVSPTKNPYLVLAVAVPFVIHLLILYSGKLGFPMLVESFNLVPLTVENWISIALWSLPILVVEEILKLISRRARLR